MVEGGGGGGGGSNLKIIYPNFSLSYSVLNQHCRSHLTMVQNQTTGHFTSRFEQKKKKAGLKFNLGLALINLGTTEPRLTI